MDAHSVNSLGLLLDIIGVVMLWKFGLPELIERAPKGQFFAELPPASEVAKAARFLTWSRCGLWLIVGGFILQLLSNWLLIAARIGASIAPVSRALPKARSSRKLH